MSAEHWLTLKIVEYCAQECEWQQSGERSVAWMTKGWLYCAYRKDHWPTFDDVLNLGALVEPTKNLNGIRKVGVRVGLSVKMKAELVPGALKHLVDAPFGQMTTDERIEWFRQYEEIHPFVDGNGRTGSLLFNWISGILLEPQHAPNLWSDQRRGAPHPSATDPNREAMTALYGHDLIDGNAAREIVSESRKGST